MIRPAAVSGQFYSSDPAALEAEVRGYRDPAAVPLPAVAAVCPHAGHRYSGHVAGAVFSHLVLPDTVVLLGPNHWDTGPPISVFPEGTWLLPGGSLTVNRSLTAALLERFPLATADTVAHEGEHCLEVLLPFLRQARPTVQIVPILLRHAHVEVYRDLGHCLAALLEDLPRRPHAGEDGGRPLLLASTDLTHYESDAITRAKDRQAIEAIQRLNPEALDEAVHRHRITMCGYGATMTVLHAAIRLGARRASLIKYATSGDVTEDRSSVVGYAGLTITT